MFTSDLNNSVANINSGIFQLQWEVQQTTNSSSSLITLSASKPLQGAVTYCFTVDARSLGEGILVLTLTVKRLCLNQNPRSLRTCSQWQYKAGSETILLRARPAKKGNSSSHHVYVCNQFVTAILGPGHDSSLLYMW